MRQSKRRNALGVNAFSVSSFLGLLADLHGQVNQRSDSDKHTSQLIPPVHRRGLCGLESPALFCFTRTNEKKVKF